MSSLDVEIVDLVRVREPLGMVELLVFDASESLLETVVDDVTPVRLSGLG